MITPLSVREADALKVKLKDLKMELDETVKRNEELENEYSLKKAMFEKEIIQMGRILVNQKKKLDDLDKEENELNFKLNVADQEIFEFECNSRNIKDDMEKQTTDKKPSEGAQKEVQRLERCIKQIHQKLIDEKNYEKEREKAYEKSKNMRAKEYEDKLNAVKERLLKKYKEAEAKYESKKRSLMYEIECLDADIEVLQKKILEKPKEEEALKKKQLKLEKELLKAAMESLLSEINMSLMAVNKTLAYIKNHPQILYDDVILGIVLAKSNFFSILRRLSLRHLQTNDDNDEEIYKKLSELMAECDVILQINKTENPILNFELWKNAAETITFGSLKLHPEFILPEFQSCEDVDHYLMEGTPENSDLCIDELYRSKCNISKDCWFSETNENLHSGYKTSHRLLYLQIASKLNCETKNPEKYYSIKIRKKNLCQQMLLEARKLSERPFFLWIHDLFLEQIALCGMEGFGEFGYSSWRKAVRSWQSKTGCFGHDMFLTDCSQNGFRKRIKRMDFMVDDNCHTHTTSVALSAMSFHLRLLITAYFSRNGDNIFESMNLIFTFLL